MFDNNLSRQVLGITTNSKHPNLLSLFFAVVCAEWPANNYPHFPSFYSNIKGFPHPSQPRQNSNSSCPTNGLVHFCVEAGARFQAGGQPGPHSQAPLPYPAPSKVQTLGHLHRIKK